jgi:hypothetical protein
MTATPATGSIPRMTKNRDTLLTAAGLAACAAGILVQIAAGAAGYPTIPPGAVITGVAALLVAFVPWRFAPALGLAVALFISAGAVVTPNTGDRLAEPGAAGPFLGTVIQVAGLAAAVVFGVLAVVRAVRTGRFSPR